MTLTPADECPGRSRGYGGTVAVVAPEQPSRCYERFHVASAAAALVARALSSSEGRRFKLASVGPFATVPDILEACKCSKSSLALDHSDHLLVVYLSLSELMQPSFSISQPSFSISVFS